MVFEKITKNCQNNATVRILDGSSVLNQTVVFKIIASIGSVMDFVMMNLIMNSVTMMEMTVVWNT